MSEKRDYYEVLGVSKDADDKELKKAFRSLARKYHPDKNSDRGADDVFKAVSVAFDVLRDPEKRSSYDRFGPNLGRPGGGAGRGGGGHPFAQGSDISPEDLFNAFFNGELT